MKKELTKKDGPGPRMKTTARKVNPPRKQEPVESRDTIEIGDYVKVTTVYRVVRIDPLMKILASVEALEIKGGNRVLNFHVDELEKVGYSKTERATE